MARSMLTVCLPPTPPERVTRRLSVVMERFDYDYLQEPRQPEWDWWFIYGGEDDTALPLRCGSEDDPRVIRSPNRHSGEPRQLTMARCDGAPRELLDFDDDRRRAADIARIRWTSWQDHLKGLPSPKPLSEITENYKRLVRVAKEEIQPLSGICKSASNKRIGRQGAGSGSNWRRCRSSGSFWISAGGLRPANDCAGRAYGCSANSGRPLDQFAGRGRPVRVL